MRTVVWERDWRKTVSFKEQIIFEDKQTNIFLRQMEGFMLIIILKRLTNNLLFRVECILFSVLW